MELGDKAKIQGLKLSILAFPLEASELLKLRRVPQLGGQGVTFRALME